MEQVKIVEQEVRLSSILALEMEVNGFSGLGFNIQALISQKMNAKTKYWLGKLSKKLSIEKKSYDDLRNDLIKKYGSETEDPKTKEKNWGISAKVKDPDFTQPTKKENPNFDAGKDWPMIQNPAIKEFMKEEKELLRQIVKIKLPKFDIDELFCFETDSVYANASELLIQDENGEYSDLDYPEEL